jgi:hypothetical protein
MSPQAKGFLPFFVRMNLVVRCMKVRLLSLRLKQQGVRANDGVRLCLLHDVDEVRGGETKGGGTVVRFCSKPRDVCEIASHTKTKANLQQGCLHPCVPKKGVNQVRLEALLSLSLVSPDTSVDMLLLEEKRQPCGRLAWMRARPLNMQGL